MSKHLHPGKAAFNGVLAADLARRGFTGATRILEGERGFFRATAAGCDAVARHRRTRARSGRSRRTATSCIRAAGTRTPRSTSRSTSGRDADGHEREALRCRTTSTSRRMAPGYEIVNDAEPSHAVSCEVQHCLLRRRRRWWKVGWAGAVLCRRFDDDGVARAGDRRAAAAHSRDRRATISPPRTRRAWPTRVVVDAARRHRGCGRERLSRAGTRKTRFRPTTLEDKFVRLVAPRWRGVRAAGARPCVASDECAATWRRRSVTLAMSDINPRASQHARVPRIGSRAVPRIRE